MLLGTVLIRMNKSLTLEEQYDNVDYYPSHCPGHFFPSQAYSGIDILLRHDTHVISHGIES
jgi:hypothetical protein